MTAGDAYAACARLAARHYENFPVASRLVPAHMRPHVAAVYAFARVADDIADEGSVPPEVREARLDEWRKRLHAAAEGRDPAIVDTTLDASSATQAPAVFVAVAESIRTLGLPVGLFDDLISAFRQDVTVTRYGTWTDVLDYCRRSANPVGRLVLRIAGYRDARLDEASDAVCTALQLANFWQDLAIDWRRGRLYVPAEEYERAGASLASLDAGAMTPEWRAVMAAAAARTRALFEAGRGVCDAVAGRLRWELRFTWLGGMRILDRLEASAYDVFHSRPTLGARDVPALAWGALRWRS